MGVFSAEEIKKKHKIIDGWEDERMGVKESLK